MTGSSKIVIWLRALGSAVVVAALTAGVPWLLVVTVGNPYPDTSIGWAHPLTDDTLLGVLAALAWIFWAQMITCLLVEAVAEIRTARGASGDWLTRVPLTFGGQQNLARVLVNAIVAVGLGASSAASVAAPATTTDPRWMPAVSTSTFVPSAAALTVTLAPAKSDSSRGDDGAHLVTVAKGDTLWSLAEQHLGSGELWTRIAELNHGRLMPDGAQFIQASAIRPGWTLLVPDPPGRRSRQVTVEAGDTLWALADKKYGDGDAWRRVYAANRDQIADPDVIYPGQVLNVPRRPGSLSTPPGSADRPQWNQQLPSVSHHGSPTPGGLPPEPVPSDRPQSSASASPPAALTSPSPSSPKTSADGRSSLRTLLTGGGSLLAASALALLMTRRRAQARRRRAGRTIARTPGHLTPTERVMREAGSTATARAAFLDRALRDLSRRLAAMGGGLPDVAAARIDDDRLDLLLNEPASEAPTPWVHGADALVWSISREAELDPCDAIAPYPTLVSIGVDDEGAVWLLDLESAGVVGITGEEVAAAGLARFVAAELAVNVWSDDVETIVSGFGAELRGMRPGRIRHTTAPPLEDLAKTARRVAEATRTMGYDVLAGRLDGRGADTFMPTVLVDVVEPGDVELPPELAPRDARQAVAVVLVGPSVAEERVRLTLAGDSTGTVHPWDVPLRFNFLTAEEAGGIAGLLENSDLAEDEAMPTAEGGSPVDEFVDVAGAVRSELVEKREPESVNHTLLPDADEEYLSRAATTVEDLGALAPVVPDQTKKRILELDPELDRDLTDWEDSDCPRPKLRLLGPVEVTAGGERTLDIERRLAYYTEIVTYLATRDHGATPEQTADVFNVQPNSIHSRVGSVRKWLGTDPETGEWYLPESTLSPSAKARGIPTYELVGALCDADLFHRLRARAQARGPDGMEDLVEALRLVRGAPFDQPRRGGYGWLSETPQDHYLTAAVVDVAHIVATDALKRRDTDRARWAAELAVIAAPSDDRPRLDLAAVVEVEAGSDAARRFLRASERDDDDAPLDALGAGAEVRQRRGWT